VRPAAELKRDLLPADRDIERLTVGKDARVALRDGHAHHHEGVPGDGQVMADEIFGREPEER
jgi:hypothetical protein